MRRSSQAEYVIVPANQLTPRPSKVPWEVAGSLFVAGVTAYAAVRAVHLVPGDTVVIAGALEVSVRLRSARPTQRRHGLGIAGPSNDAWLTGHARPRSTMETISGPITGRSKVRTP